MSEVQSIPDKSSLSNRRVGGLRAEGLRTEVEDRSIKEGGKWHQIPSPGSQLLSLPVSGPPSLPASQSFRDQRSEVGSRRGYI
jgi:hypothetical protein